MIRFFKPALLACAMSLSPLTAGAQPISELCTDAYTAGPAFNIDALATQVSGTWSQVASGTGFTRGTHVNQAQIFQDKVSKRLMVQGGQARAELKPIASAPIKSGMSLDTLSDVQLEYLEEGVENGTPFKTEINTTADKLLDLYECPPERTPAFWWQLNQGGGVAYGMLVFLTPKTAFGFMRNSSGGSREFFMFR